MRYYFIFYVHASSSFRLELAKPSDLQKVWEHFLNEFCPAEPMFRSIGTFGEDNAGKMGGKIAKWIMKKYFIKPMLSNGVSVVAWNDADEIVGKLQSAVFIHGKGCHN